MHSYAIGAALMVALDSRLVLKLGKVLEMALMLSHLAIFASPDKVRLTSASSLLVHFLTTFASAPDVNLVECSQQNCHSAATASTYMPTDTDPIRMRFAT